MLKLNPKRVFLEYIKRIFEENPKFNPNKIEIDESIEKLFETYLISGDKLISNFEKFRKELLEIVKSIKPLNQKIKCLLIIPSYKEEKNILKTLENYASCDSIDKVAIFILENHTNNVSRDNTYSEIEKFRIMYPQIELYHIYKVFKNKEPIGLIRKFITECALYLAYYNSSNLQNLILVGGDADCISISKNFFTNILNRFNTNPYLDAVELKLDFPKSYRLQYPTLWVLHRLYEFSWKFLRIKVSINNSIRMYGPASAIKASSYIMIKGFNPQAIICEDLQLSWFLDQARRYEFIKGKHFDYISSTIETNPRRALSSYLSGNYFLEQYSDFNENETIKGLNWKEIIENEKNHILNIGNTLSINDFKDTLTNKQIKTSLEYNFQEYINWWKFKVEKAHWMTLNQFKEMLEMIMDYLKIKYSIQFSNKYWNFKILNVDNLIKNLQEKGISNLQVINYQVKEAEIENIYEDLEPEIKKILIKHLGNNLYVKEFYELTGGIFSKVYSIELVNPEQYLILKIRGSERSLLKEKKILDFLTSQNLPNLSIPKILYSGYVRKKFIKKFYLIMSNLNGENLNSRIDKMTDLQKINIAKDLGYFLGELHKIKSFTSGEIIDITKLKGSNNSWKEYLFLILNKYLNKEMEKDKNKRLYTDNEIMLIRKAFQMKTNLFENIKLNSFLHNDLWEENIIIDSDKKIIGIIDFESVILGDPEFELALVEESIKNWGINPNYFLNEYSKIGKISSDYNEKKKFYIFQRYLKTSMNRNVRSQRINFLLNNILNVI